ncbi:COG4223 family protein [Phenylobacterium sp.]|uniref:COG4223 family protein n=1 Tax=Phenylobacterium sp. TaxID=1871053 RepID=UPI003566A246
MTPTSDAPDITAPKDPAAYRPRPLLGATFWAMIAFAVLCVLAGVGIATFGPRLFERPAARPAAEAAPVAEAPVPAPIPAASPALAPAPAPTGPDVERLSARVATLESHQAHASQAAAAALAVSAVVEAAQGTGPFADELASLRAVSPPSPELESLARLAQAGAPSRTALAASFPDYAARAASAARDPGDKAGLGDRIVYELSRIVSLRRVGDVPGEGVDALLARAERQVEDGDLDRALRTLDRLPAGARDALAPWRGRAERRAEIDRNAQALRARTLQALALEARGGA